MSEPATSEKTGHPEPVRSPKSRSLPLSRQPQRNAQNVRPNQNLTQRPPLPLPIGAPNQIIQSQSEAHLGDNRVENNNQRKPPRSTPPNRHRRVISEELPTGPPPPLPPRKKNRNDLNETNAEAEKQTGSSIGEKDKAVEKLNYGKTEEKRILVTKDNSEKESKQAKESDRMIEKENDNDSLQDDKGNGSRLRNKDPEKDNLKEAAKEEEKTIKEEETAKEEKEKDKKSEKERSIQIKSGNEEQNNMPKNHDAEKEKLEKEENEKEDDDDDDDNDKTADENQRLLKPVTKRPAQNKEVRATMMNPSEVPANQKLTFLSEASKANHRDYIEKELALKMVSRRDMVAREIFISERSYLEMLSLGSGMFYSKLISSGVLSKDEANELFGNYNDILNVNSFLLTMLEERMEKWSDTQTIGDVFLKIIPFFKVYALYTQNYEGRLRVLEEYERRSNVVRFLEERMMDPICKQQAIRSYLILPVQRLPRYRMLISDLLQLTEPSHPDYDNILKAKDGLVSVASLGNEAVKLHETRLKMIETQKRFGDYIVLEPHRTIVREGEILKVCRRAIKQRVLFLFNDIVIYGTITPLGIVSVRGSFSLFDARVDDIPDSDTIVNSFLLITRKKSFRAIATSRYEKYEWLIAFMNTITALSSLHKRASAFEAPVWQQDSLTNTCNECGNAFNVLNRRHHCRVCGLLFCNNCTAYRVLIPNETEKQRCCTRCAKKSEDRIAKRLTVFAPDGITKLDDETEKNAFERFEKILEQNKENNPPGTAKMVKRVAGELPNRRKSF